MTGEPVGESLGDKRLMAEVATATVKAALATDRTALESPIGTRARAPLSRVLFYRKQLGLSMLPERHRASTDGAPRRAGGRARSTRPGAVRRPAMGRMRRRRRPSTRGTRRSRMRSRCVSEALGRFPPGAAISPIPGPSEAVSGVRPPHREMASSGGEGPLWPRNPSCPPPGSSCPIGASREQSTRRRSCRSQAR